MNVLWGAVVGLVYNCNVTRPGATLIVVFVECNVAVWWHRIIVDTHNYVRVYRCLYMCYLIIVHHAWTLWSQCVCFPILGLSVSTARVSGRCFVWLCSLLRVQINANVIRPWFIIVVVSRQWWWMDGFHGWMDLMNGWTWWMDGVDKCSLCSRHEQK